jgi:hypothetical protein
LKGRLIKQFIKSSQRLLLAPALIASMAGQLYAQGTVFTYQGRLNDGGVPANGLYDLRFGLYDSTNSPGTLIAGPLTNSAVGISNGLFAATLDFGGVFTGTNYWLEVAVQTNHAGFTALSPRQPILAVPYAVFANTAGNLLGTVSNSSLPASPNFGGTVTAANFSGNGAGLTNFNATQITGTLPVSRLPAGVALLDATQSFSGRNFFAGILARGGPPGANGVNNNGYAFSGNGGDNDSGMSSSANGQIEFYNNSVEVMRVLNGYVGIGTTNPTAPLTVMGANPFPQLAVIAPSNSLYGSFLSLDASATTGGKNYLIFSTGNSAGEGQGNLIFQNHSDGYEIMSLTSTGNVGIGTLTPSSLLSLGGGVGNDKLAIWDNGDPTTTMGLGVASYQFRIHLPNSANRFSFLDNPGGSNELVTILGTGNVGIGTNNPASKLQVMGNIQLGGGGTNYAASSQENLRIVRGTIDLADHVLRGTGFTVVSNGVGDVTITFSPSFSGTPTMSINTSYRSYWTGITSAQAEIVTETFDGTPINDLIDIIAIGPP